MYASFRKILLNWGFGPYWCPHLCGLAQCRCLGLTMLDNFCNSHPHALARMERINYKKPTLVCGDIPDSAAFRTVLRPSGVSLVLNFVELKSVGESVQRPMLDCENYLAGCLNLHQVL